jgi:hypothetical protein
VVLTWFGALLTPDLGDVNKVPFLVGALGKGMFALLWIEGMYGHIIQHLTGQTQSG